MNEIQKFFDSILAGEPSVSLSAKKEADKTAITINLEGVSATITDGQLNYSGSIADMSRMMKAVEALSVKSESAPAVKPSPVKTAETVKEEKKPVVAPEPKATTEDLPEDPAPKPAVSNGNSRVFETYFQEAREASAAKDYKKTLQLLEKCLSCEMNAESKNKVLDAIVKTKARLAA